MDTQADLLAEIEAFTQERGIAETTFGLRAVNDGKFVRRLREKRPMLSRTIETARRFITEERARIAVASREAS